MKVYILSPHFDDAAYGLTITISQLINRGVSVNLINCFTVTKWTALPVENKDVKSVSLLRATEDQEYNKIFNSAINIINLDLLDAPLRNGYIFQSATFAPNEKELVDELSSYIEANVDGILLCPLGIGNHIDHAICRAAVAKVYGSKKVLFYEDLPYAQRITEEQIIEHITQLEEEIHVQLQSSITSLKETKTNKEQAINVYKSQINDEIRSEIIARMNVLQGERLWGDSKVIDELRALL